MDDSWIDELIKWENAHPEYEPFKEDKDSQREQNTKENYWNDTVSSEQFTQGTWFLFSRRKQNLSQSSIWFLILLWRV